MSHTKSQEVVLAMKITEDMELLVTREMPFGKHTGVLIADLPGNYLNWFARDNNGKSASR